MNDAEYEAMRDGIESAHVRWRERLMLGHWRGTLVWMRDSNHEASMEVHSKWPYLYYTIDVHMLAVSLSNPPADYDELIAHELVHVVLAPLLGRFPASLDGTYDREHEHVTTHLSRSFAALVEGDALGVGAGNGE